jgi:hypothetical protein
MDIDATGIAELIRRKYEISAKLARGRKTGGGVLEPAGPQAKFTSSGVDAMSVYTSVQDLTAGFDACVAAATRHGEPVGEIDAIACMFAIHYFCKDTATIAEVLRFVHFMLKPGGKFMFTTMDGKAIFKLFSGGGRSLRTRAGGAPPLSTWEIREPADAPPKYAIRREFTGETLAAAGQMIAVKLPFSEEMRSEPLANIDHILGAAREIGFVVDKHGGFGDHIEEAAGTPFYEKLTDGDKKYIKLHTYVVMHKRAR